MQKKQDTLNTPPVELSMEQLQSVAGGLPRGGWGQEGDPITDDSAAAAVATAAVEPTPLPRGGW